MEFSKQLANLARTASTATTPGQGSSSTSHSTDRRGPNAGRVSERRIDNNNKNNDRYSSSRFGYSGGYHGGGGRGGRGSYQPRRDERRGGNQPYHGGGRSRGPGRGGLIGSNRDRTYSEEDDGPLLKKLVESIPLYQPIVVPKKPKRRHIALLFLSIDDLPFEHIWRGWFDSLSSSSAGEGMMVSALSHAKFPERVRSQWLKQRMLVVPQRRKNNGTHRQLGDNKTQDDVKYHSRRPEWGSIEITRAMIDLLDEALKIGSGKDHLEEPYSTRRYLATSDNKSFVGGVGVNAAAKSLQEKKSGLPTVDRFIFVSETCMPVSTLAEVELALFGDHTVSSEAKQQPPFVPANTETKDMSAIGLTTSAKYFDAGKSWVNARNTPNNGYARQQQWDMVSSAIPRQNIWKADQWIVLTRHHAWPILSLIEDASQSVIQSQGAKGGGGGDRGRNKPALWQCFRQTKASDEIYFPTAISLLGILPSSSDLSSSSSTGETETFCSSPEIAKRRVTYCDWNLSLKNPATFPVSRNNEFKEFREIVKLARDEGCLFARKFSSVLTSPSDGNPSLSFTECSAISGSAEVTDSAAAAVNQCITFEEWLSIVSKSEKNTWFL